MKIALKLSLILLLTPVFGLAQMNDRKFISADGGFKMALPSSYKTSNFEHISDAKVGIDGEGKSYLWDVYPINFTKITYYLLVKRRGALTPADKILLLAYIKDGMIKGAASIAAPITEKEYSFQGSKGIEMQVEYPTRKAIIRLFVVGSRLFCLTMVFPRDLDEPQFLELLDSFSLLGKEELIAAKIAQATPETLPQTPRAAKARTDAEDDGLKGKVKSVLEDNEEPSVKRERFSENYFDEAGFRVKGLAFEEGYPQAVAVWGYIENKRVSSEDYINFDDDQRPPLRKRIIMRLDEIPPEVPADISIGPVDAGIAVPAKKPLYDSSLEYKYDEQKRLIETISHGEDGTVFGRTVIKYSPGKIETITYEYDETESFHTVRILDKDGNVAEEYSLDKKGRPSNRHTYKYEFDTQGNWVVRKAYEQKTVKGKPLTKLLRTAYRTITYYS